MGYFYFDESIHARADFIIGAFVYSAEPLEGPVAQALAEVGLRPGIDEFKSCARADSNAAHRELRHRLRSLIDRLGLVVAPTTHRHLLARDALDGLAKIIANNGLDSEAHTAYFDQGVFNSQGQASRLAREVGLASSVDVVGTADSRAIGGIQVADVAAHAMATMLLEAMGYITKTVKAGDNSGYDPDLDINIGFELWAGLRYRFFMKERDVEERADEYDPLYDVESCGLHISPRCSEAVRDSALGRFGMVYLGCIH